jgi:hypothetical protein
MKNIARKMNLDILIVPIDNKKSRGHSPLEGIKGIKANVSTEELVEIIREGREGREYFKEKY